MILIADSGSTKTNWCLLNDRQGVFFFDTEGYNPYFVDTGYIFHSLSQQLPDTIDRSAVSHVFFYGAGCFDNKTAIVSDALTGLFPAANISVQLDLLASARAVLGDEPGFVAILGTGTNSCLYDGTAIVANIDSLGYLLGDEGSGFYMGRKLLADYIRGYMPRAVQQEFFDRYRYTREEIMEKVYADKLPNRFCAGFVPFLFESRAGGDYTRGIAQEAFAGFFTHIVSHYPDYTRYTFNCVGSVGDAFRDLLTATAQSFGMRAGTILKSPIAALAEYHYFHYP